MMHSKDKACSSFQTITSNVHNHSITTSCIISILLTIIPLLLAFTKFGVIILLKMETHARLHGLRVFLSSLTGVATTYEYEAWS